MAGRTVTVELPDDLYDRLERRAGESRRSVGDEVVAALQSSAPSNGAGVSPGFEAAFARLATLDDATLLELERRRIPMWKLRRLEALNYKSQRVGLNSEEKRVAARLADEFDRRMLLRAHLLLLLKQRGYDLDALLARR